MNACGAGVGVAALKLHALEAKYTAPSHPLYCFHMVEKPRHLSLSLNPSVHFEWDFFGLE